MYFQGRLTTTVAPLLCKSGLPFDPRRENRAFIQISFVVVKNPQSGIHVPLLWDLEQGNNNIRFTRI